MIELLNKWWKQTIQHTNETEHVWEYALVYESDIISQTVTKSGRWNGWYKATVETTEFF